MFLIFLFTFKRTVLYCNTSLFVQWNDSIDDSPEGKYVSRLHLPSPKRKVISPLKKYTETRLVRRRKSKKWSLLEEDTLRTAVQRYVFFSIVTLFFCFSGMNRSIRSVKMVPLSMLSVLL